MSRPKLKTRDGSRLGIMFQNKEGKVESLNVQQVRKMLAKRAAQGDRFPLLGGLHQLRAVEVV